MLISSHFLLEGSEMLKKLKLLPFFVFVSGFSCEDLEMIFSDVFLGGFGEILGVLSVFFRVNGWMAEN